MDANLSFLQIQPFLAHMGLEEKNEEKNGSVKLDDFFNIVSNETWLKKYPNLSLRAIKLIPRQCIKERERLIKTIETLGLTHLNTGEIRIAMKEACIQADIEIIKLLMPYLNPPNALDEGFTVLHYMARTCTSEEITQVFTEKQLKTLVNQVNDHKISPLQIAASSGRLDTVKLFVKLGAKIDDRNIHGRTALAFATSEGKKEVVTWLVEQGADINAVDIQGETPLKYCGAKGNLELFKELLRLGAKAEVLDKKGLSPLYYLMNSVSTSADLDAVTAADRGLTKEIIDRILLAHRFSLKGMSPVGTLGSVSLEGTGLGIAVPQLSVAIRIYYAHLQSALTSETNEQWKNILATLSPETLAAVEALDKENILKVLGQTADAISKSLAQHSEVMQAHETGTPVCIASGLPGHVISIALLRDRLAICNRGYGCDEFPGVLIYEISNLDKLKESLAKCIPGATEEYILDEIKFDLGLNNSKYLRQHEQKVGNCAIANTQSAELALLFMQLEPLLGPKVAEEFARAIKRGRTKDTRINSLESYLNWHRQPRPYPPDLKLLGQIFQKTTSDKVLNSNIKSLIGKWAKEMRDQGK